MKNLSFGVLIIPSLNPDEKLVSVVREAVEYFSDIILVNDGSGKEYESVFRRITDKFDGIHYLKHSENKGKGYALKSAMQYFRSNPNFDGYDGVVTADGDGQHEINDIIAIDKQLGLHNEKSLIIGCRDLNSEVMPPRSKFGNKSTAFLFKTLYGIKLKDTQSGLRAFSKDIIPWLLDVDGSRFEYEMNMLIKSKNTDVVLREYPISTKYEEKHKSHFRSFVDSLRVMRVLFSGIISFIIAGLVAGIADIGLFAFFNEVVMPQNGSLAINLLVATVVARVLSSIINFVFNRFITFGGKKISSKSILKYYALWFAQLLTSYLLVLLLSTISGGREVLIKFLVDLLLALLSYQIQMKWVFRKKEENSD